MADRPPDPFKGRHLDDPSSYPPGGPVFGRPVGKPGKGFEPDSDRRARVRREPMTLREQWLLYQAWLLATERRPRDSVAAAEMAFYAGAATLMQLFGKASEAGGSSQTARVVEALRREITEAARRFDAPDPPEHP